MLFFLFFFFLMQKGSWVCRNVGEGGLADDAAEKADRGNTDLDAGQKSCGVFPQLDRHRRRTIAAFGQPSELRAAWGDQRTNPFRRMKSIAKNLTRARPSSV